MRHSAQPSLEILEDRTVPAGFSLESTASIVFVGPVTKNVTNPIAQSHPPELQLPAVQDIDGFLGATKSSVFADPQPEPPTRPVPPEAALKNLVNIQSNLPAVQLPAVQDQAVAKILFPVFAKDQLPAVQDQAIAEILFPSLFNPDDLFTSAAGPANHLTSDPTGAGTVN